MTGRERELPAAGPSGGALSVGQGARVGVPQGTARREGGKPGAGAGPSPVGVPGEGKECSGHSANSAPWEKQGRWQLESRAEFWKDHSVKSVRLRRRNIVTALICGIKKEMAQMNLQDRKKLSQT